MMWASTKCGQVFPWVPVWSISNWTVLLKLAKTVTGDQQKLALPGWASNFSLQRSGKEENNLPLLGAVGRTGLQMERFGVQTTTIHYARRLTCKSCTEGKWQVFKYHQGCLLVPRTITSLQTVIASSIYLETVLSKVIHSVSWVKSRLHSSDGWWKANSNKYIIPKGLSKQPIKIQNLFFMYWLHSFSMWHQKKYRFFDRFLFPTVTKMHPLLKAASHTTLILPNLSPTKPAANNLRP